MDNDIEEDIKIRLFAQVRILALVVILFDLFSLAHFATNFMRGAQIAFALSEFTSGYRSRFG